MIGRNRSLDSALQVLLRSNVDTQLHFFTCSPFLASFEYSLVPSILSLFQPETLLICPFFCLSFDIKFQHEVLERLYSDPGECRASNGLELVCVHSHGSVCPHHGLTTDSTASMTTAFEPCMPCQTWPRRSAQPGWPPPIPSRRGSRGSSEIVPTTHSG